jgi:hypothetical protein
MNLSRTDSLKDLESWISMLSLDNSPERLLSRNKASLIRLRLGSILKFNADHKSVFSKIESSNFAPFRSQLSNKEQLSPRL